MLKKTTPLLVAAALLMTALPAPTQALAAGPTTLPDVAGHWAEPEIRAAAAAGWVNGYPDGSFKPDGTVTRAEFLKMISLVRGGARPAIDDQRLSLLYGHLAEQSHWAVTGGYVKTALAKNILEPTDYPVKLDSQGKIDAWTLGPDTPVTRLDAAILVSRALGSKYQAEAFWYHPGSLYSPRRAEPKSYYPDALPDWATGWVATASETGIIKGYPDGSFKGDQTVKRSEAVVMLRRLATREAAPATVLTTLEGPQTPAMLNRDNLYYLNFTPVLTLRFDVGNTWDETGKSWAALSRADRAKAVREHTEKFWAESKAKGYFPLDVRSVMVNVVGQPNQGLGEGHFDGTNFEYLDVNGNADPADPDSSIDLKAHLQAVPGNEDLQAQFDRYLANARTNYQALPPEPQLIDTFPYQYLGDWYRFNPEDVLTYAKSRADTYFKASKARLAAIGVDLKQVTYQIAPSDTADRAGQYRSLLIGQTLIANAALTATYDGKALTVVSRPTTLQAYVTGLTPQYEMVPAGEGYGEPRIDPAPAVARQVMESFIYALGMK